MEQRAPKIQRRALNALKEPWRTVPEDYLKKLQIFSPHGACIHIHFDSLDRLLSSHIEVKCDYSHTEPFNSGNE